MKRVLTGFILLFISISTNAYTLDQACSDAKWHGIYMQSKFDEGMRLQEFVKHWKEKRPKFNEFDMDLIKWIWSRRNTHKHAADAMYTAEEWCMTRYQDLSDQIRARNGL